MYNLLITLKKSPLGKYFLNNRVSTIRFGIAKGLKRKGGLGILGLFNTAESKEELYIKNLKMTNKVIYDIGANFGAFALYFLKHAGELGYVVAFEPIKNNCDEILENVKINKLGMQKIAIFNLGIGKVHQKKVLTFDPMNTSRASFNTSIADQIKTINGSVQEEIEIDALDNIISRHSLPEPYFIKIDVEGFEFEVLQGMTNILQTRKPQLFIEIHGSNERDKKENIERIVNFLGPFGYEIKHVESDLIIGPQNCSIAAFGHIHCK
jgi:FkbM family methyltransferase